MRFEALRLRNIRRFGPEGLALEALSQGLNVLTAPNEFGKSTLLDALRIGLFVKDSSKKQETAGSLRSRGLSADPLIEVDFETEEGAFQLSKRFAEGRKDSMTRLVQPGGVVLLGDEADQKLRHLLTSDKPQDGPVGLLWLGQGDTLRGIVSGDKQSVASDQARTMDALLSGEVAAAASSDDVPGITAAARDLLKDRETPKTQKPTGRLADVLAQVQQLEAQHAERTAQVERGATLRLELRSKEEALRSLEDPELAQARRAEREETEKAAADTPRLRTEIGSTRQFLARETADLEALESDLGGFDGSARALEKHQKNLGMAKKRAGEFEQEIGHTAQKREASRVRQSRASDRAASLRRDLDIWRQAEAAQQSAATRKRLEEDLITAKALVVKRSGLEDFAKADPIDLPALRRAEQAVEAATAKLEATAPTLTVKSGGPVSLDGEILPSGASASVTGEGTIEVGSTVLSLAVAGRESLLTELGAARDKLSRLLSETKSLSLQNATEREEARHRAAVELEHLDRSLKALAPAGIDALQAALQKLNEVQNPQTLPDQDAEGTKLALSDTEALIIRATEEESSLAKRLDALTHDRTELRITIETQAREIERLLEAIGPEEEREERRQALTSKIEALKTSIGGRQHHLGELNKALQRARAAEADLQRLREADANVERKRTELQVAIARIEVELAQHYEAGAQAELAALAEELEQARQLRDQLELRRGGLRLLLDVIAEEEEIRRETVIAPVLSILNPMLERVFGEAELRFDGEWNPVDLQRPGHVMAAKDLSAGTREQIAVLTRLAFAQLMADQGHPIPVILDDALGYADDQRARRLFGVIREVAESTQVIVLSCHEQLFAQLGGQPIEPKPWA